MSPRMRGLIKLGVLLAVVAVLLWLFPRAFGFAEMAARELRYLWWIVLLVVLAGWLIWGGTRRPK